jgi:uroporphyrinogen decarboxylase
MGAFRTEEMTCYERVMIAARGGQPDRVPVLPAIRDWSIRHAGFKISEVLANVEKYVFATYFCQKKFGFDGVCDLVAVHSESEAMGSLINIQDDIAPSVIKPAINDYDKDLCKLRILNPYKDGRLPVHLKIIERLKELCGGTIPVFGYVQMPFRHACMLRGVDHVMRDMYKNPERLKELLEISLTSLVVYGIAVAQAGSDFLYLSDPTSSGDVISRNLWETFVFDYSKRLIDALKKTGVPVLLHICGDTSDRLDSFASLGADILSLDQKVDFGFARERIGEQVCLMGNIDPVGTLLLGNPARVLEECKQVISKGGRNGNFILSSGCIVSADTPEENIVAMVDAAKEYGKYPLKDF